MEIKPSVPKIPSILFSNPKIKTLQQQIGLIQMQNQLLLDQYQKTQKELHHLRSKYHHEPDLAIKERLLKEIKDLETAPPPKVDEEKIKQLELKIAELQLADQINNQEQQRALQQKYIESLPAKTGVTGFLIKVIISSPPQASRSNHYLYPTQTTG